MAALMKNAMVSATVVSIVLNRMARRMDDSSCCNLRVCTKAVWRYRLWGMTVAPIMPIATTSMPACAKSGCAMACPISRKSGRVCANPKISMP